MGKISKVFGNPGIRTDVHQQTIIPLPDGKEHDEKKSEVITDVESVDDELLTISKFSIQENGEITTSIGFTGLKKGKTDRVLDTFVEWAGSQILFIIMMLIFLAWLIFGIIFKGSYVWQVVMQDAQSIQCYIWDTLLMRQQLMSAHEHMCICAELGSRITIFKKLAVKVDSTKQSNFDSSDLEMVSADLASTTWHDKLSSVVSLVIGSWYAVVIFWLGVFVWVGCGALLIDAGNTPPFTGIDSGDNPEKSTWGNMWQMYMNTSTAIILFLTSVFLQNIRARHDIFIGKFIKKIFLMDITIDLILRHETKDFKTQADVVTVKAQKRTKGEFWIDWYGDIIGTGTGVALAIIVFAAWIVVGHPMGWDDDWWLLIGTYTGLVGFIDGFVIRQNYFRNVKSEEDNYESLLEKDIEIYTILGITCPENLVRVPEEPNQSIIYRISKFVNNACSHQYSVLFSVVFTIALICIASALRWSVTGQLIANTPTMIIESFFFLILFQALNWADCTRRAEIALLYNRRVFLLAYLKSRFSTFQEIQL